jgi:hypothetical protein
MEIEVSLLRPYGSTHKGSSSGSSWRLKMKAAHSFENFVINNHDIQRKNPEGMNSQYEGCTELRFW